MDSTKPRKLTPEDNEHIINRQINYYIIRATYDIVNGYITAPNNPDRDFYDLLDISHGTYDTLIRTGQGRDYKKKIDTWQALTGIDRRIFTGAARFNDGGLDYDGKFADDIEDKRQGIRDCLKVVLNREVRDPNLQALILFSRHGKEAISQSIVKRNALLVCNTMDAIELKHLTLLSEDELSSYIERIENHLEICRAARVFVRCQRTPEKRKP